jgi:hypothetical protein
MPIKPVSPPADVTSAAVSSLRSLASAAGPALADDVSAGELELVAPHRVYTLPFGAIRGDQLAATTFAGWRFLIVAGDRVLGSAEVPAGGGAAAVSTGPFAQATADAIDRIEDLPEVRAGAPELRILKINSLYLVAAWLVGNPQLIIPLTPAPWFVTAGEAYTEAAFFRSLSQPGVRPLSTPR